MFIRIGILIAALLIRLALLPGKGFPDDLHCFAAWMHALVTLGPRGLYLDTSNSHFPSVDYPPAYLYILWGLGWVEHQLFGTHPSELIDRVIEKLPATIADFFLAFSVSGIAERLVNRRAGTQVLAFLLLSPVLWLISSYWGQVDVLAALGLVLAIRSAFNERYLQMWIIAAVTILIKPQPIVALPLLWLYQARRSREHLLLVCGPLLSLLTAYLLALPAAPVARPDLTLLWLLQRYTIGIAKYPTDSTGAFNLYTILGNSFGSDATAVTGISLHTIGMSLALTFIAASLIILFVQLGSITRHLPSRDAWRESAMILLQTVTIAILALYLFMTRMHERYEMSAITLLPLIALLNTTQRGAAISLATIFCINAAFILMGFYGGHHHPQIRSIVHLLSLVNIIAFLVLITQALRKPDPHILE